jgi:hypothetical protein
MYDGVDPSVKQEKRAAFLTEEQDKHKALKGTWLKGNGRAS